MCNLTTSIIRWKRGDECPSQLSWSALQTSTLVRRISIWCKVQASDHSANRLGGPSLMCSLTWQINMSPYVTASDETVTNRMPPSQDQQLESLTEPLRYFETAASQAESRILLYTDII